ncbi:MAG: DUF4249 domain-containing protein [Bacteroidales bacterium]|nr:DUF4249 domain-containing protein [Bacteroidales bacterium]
MNKYIFSTVILFLILVITSCYRDITLDVDDSEQKIVLQGIFFSDSLIMIHVSKSVNINYNDNQEMPVITDAKVSLYKDGEFVEVMLHKSKGLYKSTVLAEAGHSYEVIVETNNKVVKGTVDMPEIAQIDGIKYIGKDQNQWMDVIELSFSDQLNIDDYYLFDGYTYYKSYYYNDTGWYDSVDVYKDDWVTIYLPEGMTNGTINYLYFYPYVTDGIGFTDNLIGNGEVHQQLNVSAYSWDEFYPQDSFTVYFNLLHVNEDVYRFFVSNDNYENSLYNPFVEPVNVYSNIEGGIGIFAAFSLSLDSVKLPITDYYWEDKKH